MTLKLKIALMCLSSLWFFSSSSKLSQISTIKLDIDLAEKVVKALHDTYKSKDITTINLITSGSDKSFELSDFCSELMSQSFVSSKLIFRKESAKKLIAIPGRKKRFNVFLVEEIQDFVIVRDKISPSIFWLNGFYLFVMIKKEADGLSNGLENIFKELWAMQIYNLCVIYEDANGNVAIKSFKPFNTKKCNDIKPISIDSLDHLLDDKMTNLWSCSINVATSNNEPSVFAKQFKNGSYQLYGPDINLIKTLSKSLNFSLKFTFIGEFGYFSANGTSVGLMKTLLDETAEIAISNLWLKGDRASFFDSTSPYSCENIIFIVPRARDLSGFEKLFYPFKLSLWIFIMLFFLIVTLSIFIVKRRSQVVQDFVFGTRVRSPYLNLFVGFIGGVQKLLPRKNFARFILMMFLMFSLIIRTLYLGSFYKLLKSDRHHKEVESLNEMIENGYTFHGTTVFYDVLLGSDVIKNRFALLIS